MGSDDLYINTKNLNGQTYFGLVNQSLTGPAMLISQAVMYENNTIFGCCGIEVELLSLREYLNQINIYDSGYASMIDRTGRAIIHPDISNESIGSPLTDIETDTEEFNSIITHIINGEYDLEYFEKNGERWIISYSPVGKGDYSIALIVPYSEIVKSGIDLSNLISALNIPMITSFFIVFSILFCFIIIAILSMSRRITRPITDLTDSIDNMVRGDLTKEIPLEKKRKSNEIGVLAQSFQALLITMRLGNQSYYQGDTHLAYKNYFAALELFKTTQNLKGQGICWNNLGNIFRNWSEFTKAKNAYDKSIEIAFQTNDDAGLS